MKITFLDEYSVGGADLSAIKALGEYRGYEITRTPREVMERCADTEIIITNKVIISREILERLPKLKLICIAATGINNIDLDAADELGVKVRNAVGYSTTSVAEATLAAALSLIRKISYFDRYIKSGNYAKADRLFCLDRPIGQLSGSAWGIIGMGTIGREVARLATAFGCRVKYFSTSGVEREEAYERAQSMDELLEWSDIISIHAPLNDITRGLIGENEMQKMRRSAILINVARGGVVDEEALVEALNSGEISMAALDVFSSEPIEARSPIYNIDDNDKLLLSPHNAWQSEEAIETLIKAIANNIKEYKSLTLK